MKNLSVTVLWTIIGLVLIVLAAQVTLFKGAIPITLQSLAVLFIAFAFPWPSGIWSVCLYVLLGAVGLPVFLNGGAGMDELLGTTGGYLIGFILAAFLVAYLAKVGWNSNFPKMLGAMILGTILILFVGFLRNWLGEGVSNALDWTLPLLPAAGIKALVAAGLVWVWHRYRPESWIATTA
jgi:biotin transport system substrate-specific component